MRLAEIASHGCQQAHILVVDDEMGPRESLKMILNPYYNVLIADRGAQAIEMLGKSGGPGNVGPQNAGAHRHQRAGEGQGP